MLVQDHGDVLRLVRQQDHAQISGELAHAWRGASDADAGLPYRIVWATGVHDVAWMELDRAPILDPESGRPYDFHRLPLERKLGPYREGIDRVADLAAYAGFQVSRHYCSFLDDEESAEFLQRERRRRACLRPRLRPALRDGALLDRELAFLKLFDTLSLYLCLADPALEAGSRPRWLVPQDRVRTPGGGRVELAWRAPGVLELEPDPFAAPLELVVPYRQLPPSFGDEQELERRWREAEVEHETVRLVSAGGR